VKKCFVTVSWDPKNPEAGEKDGIGHQWRHTPEPLASHA
jgi:hypothetical protein